MRAVTRIFPVALLALIAAVTGCDREIPEQDLTRRVILIQGACSSTDLLSDRDHWSHDVKRELEASYGIIDLPTGDPEDQVIEFSYAPSEWDAEYSSSDTLRPLAVSSSGLAAIYNAYPDSQFFIVGHSLGGIVALDALARSLENGDGLESRTLGIATVSSPVKGLSERESDIAAFTIELIACRDISGVTSSGDVWDDLVEGSDAMSRIHAADWTSVDVINFANKRDRVANWETTHLTPPFKSHCFDIGARALGLNHDTALTDRSAVKVVLSGLIESAPLSQPCSE